MLQTTRPVHAVIHGVLVIQPAGQLCKGFKLPRGRAGCHQFSPTVGEDFRKSDRFISLTIEQGLDTQQFVYRLRYKRRAATDLPATHQTQYAGPDGAWGEPAKRLS